MEKLVKQLKVWNVIMIALAIFVLVLACIYATTRALPLGMDIQEDADETFMTAGFFILAAMIAVQTVLGFLTLRDPDKGSTCNMVGWIVFILTMVIYVSEIGGDVAADWIMLFVLCLPPTFQSAVARKIANQKISI